jgi:hypothetical protein
VETQSEPLIIRPYHTSQESVRNEFSGIAREKIVVIIVRPNHSKKKTEFKTIFLSPFFGMVQPWVTSPEHRSGGEIRSKSLP